MHDGGKRVARFAVQQNIQFDKFRALVTRKIVIKRGITFRAGFQAVKKVVNDFVERKKIFQFHARFVEVSHIGINAALILTKLHDRTNVFGRSIDVRLDNGLFHIIDFAGRG